MRVLLIVTIMCSTVYASEIDILKKQLDAIENSQEAKEELFRGIKMIKQWATEGQSSKEARDRIALTAAELTKYWGEDSTDILKKRLNGMVSVLNGQVKWSGDADKFRALKQELIEEKQKLIDKLNAPPSEKDAEIFVAVPETAIERMYKLPTRTTKELFPLAVRACEINTKELKRVELGLELLNKEIFPYMWKLPVVIKMYEYDQYNEAAIIRGYIDDPKYRDSNVSFYTTKDKIPDNWKKGDKVELFGFISTTRGFLASSHIQDSRTVQEGKKMKKLEVDQVSVRDILLFSPEYVDKNHDGLLKLGWVAREFAKEK